MPYYGPRYTPRRERQDFGELIAGAIDTYGAHKRRERADAEHVADRTRAESDRARQQELGELELALRGIQRGTAPQFESGSPLPPSMTGFGESITEALGPTARARPGFTQLTSKFYQDDARTPEGRQTALAAMERDRRRAGLVQAGVDEGMVDAILDNPTLADNAAPFQRPQSPASSEPLVPTMGPNGRPLLLPRSQAAGKEGYVTPRQATRPRSLPATEIGKFAELDALTSQAKEVAQLLAGSVRNKTNVTGRVGGVIPTPGWAKDLVGMGGDEGKDVRIAIGSLFSTLAKQRGGSALSAPEIAILETFVPSQNDPEHIAIMKANRFTRELERIKTAKLAAFQKYGYGDVIDEHPAEYTLPNTEY